MSFDDGNSGQPPAIMGSRSLSRRRPPLWLLLCCIPSSGWGGELDGHLASMTMSLTEVLPYRFVLAYHGPTTEFRGDVCYHFAGYTETCLDPGLEWLTPATELALYAPGGVPRDLLRGYVMLVRYPDLSARTYRYRLPPES